MHISQILPFLALAALLPAQAFHIPSDTPATGTANAFPFNTTDMRYQALILATDLGSTPAMITGFSLAPSANGNLRYGRVTMKMAHLSATSLSTTFDQNLAQGAITTMDITNFVWPVTGNTWNDVDLQVPFAYNGVDSVVVEFLVTGRATGVAMRRDATNQRVYQGSYTGQATGTSGGLTAFKMRVLTGNASTGVYGTGCLGSNNLTPAISFSGSSQLGQTLNHNLANALPSVPAFLVVGFYGGPVFPIDLGTFGFPGCLSYFPSVATLVAVTDGAGNASLSSTIPANPVLAGLFYYAQWAAVDTGPQGITTSNYGRVLLGN